MAQCFTNKKASHEMVSIWKYVVRKNTIRPPHHVVEPYLVTIQTSYMYINETKYFSALYHLIA